MSENDNEQQIQIGKKLRDARQAKGYTLDDLQQLTKIQKRYLIAIEDEKFDELPGDFYVRAFIKQYADTVGLDGNELLKEFNEQLPKAKTEEYSDHISQAVETQANRRKTVSQGVSKVRQYMPTIIIACVIVIVLAAIWVTAIVRGHQDSSTKIDNSSVSVSGESRKKSSSSVKKSSTKTKKSTAIKLTEASRNNNSVTYNAASLKKDAKLQIKTSGRTWNSVTTDGTNALSRTMDANSTADVTIKRTTNTVVITVGNASATTLKLGNKKINFTDNGRYNNTRTVTIHFGNSSSSSVSSSVSSSRATSGQQTAPQPTRTSQSTTTNASRTTTNQGQNRTQTQQSQTNQTQSR
ncbi:helix-turn-helix domain-containing protein [Limosilactobacillus sp. c10Ua_36]|uniref:helix-turn-helix domain-containing protein n=1 Tax=Limosilactobacillus sp. c10Ua_36 TaxID=2775910 RepID=UPI002DD662E3|nr:RodZ domain-containing protein [Limosilactobacillus sp. c10Ua_36]MEC4741112.1 helix-turn-helix domain-containing protein [Limosilactobacillus sp. c10Ua_36]